MLTAQQAEVFANAFASALTQATGYGTKAPVGTVATTGWMHGVGGIFGVPGLDQDVISARIVPMGISSVLRVVPSIYAFPEYPYITGVESDGDAEPTGPCETCPSGVTEGCIQSACFGYICRESRELTISRAIERINSGDVDMRLVNDMLGLDLNDPWRVIQSYDSDTILQIATAQAMMEVGILLQNAVLPMIWSGNPANNNGTGYMEFNGLDTLISTGKVDYHTGVACEALDSDVKDFNFQHINTVDADGNFRIVRMLAALENYIFYNATRMRLLPATWVWAMQEKLWYELTEIWPIAYLTTRNVTLPAGNTAFLDATRINDMRDQMRAGKTLTINGRTHPVVTDDGIFENNSANNPNLNPGEFASNIYLVPLTYLGNRPATYLEYKDYRAGAQEIALSKAQDFYWTDAGRFLWTVERRKYCYTMSAIVEPRIVLRTPQIAGRLDNVMINPEQVLRSPWEDSEYFFKGGVEHRTYPYGRVYPEHARTMGVIPTAGHCED